MILACRFCGAPAIARFALSEGCFAHPADREQDLCPQHIVGATPIGAMALVEILDPDVWKWFAGEKVVSMTDTFERGAENCPKCGAYPDEDGGHDCPLDKDPARREADQAEEAANQAKDRARATEKVAVKVEAQEAKAEKAEIKAQERAEAKQERQEEKDRKAQHRASDVVAGREARAAQDRLGKARDNDPFKQEGVE